MRVDYCTRTQSECTFGTFEWRYISRPEGKWHRNRFMTECTLEGNHITADLWCDVNPIAIDPVRDGRSNGGGLTTFCISYALSVHSQITRTIIIEASNMLYMYLVQEQWSSCENSDGTWQALNASSGIIFSPCFQIPQLRSIWVI